MSIEPLPKNPSIEDLIAKFNEVITFLNDRVYSREEKLD
jgi:hypothetical protein